MKTFIIDDDNISIYLTKHILNETNFSQEITFFLSAEIALEILLQCTPTSLPQVIFLDLNMPGMNGWDFLEALNPYKGELLGRCRIYILTSSLDVSDTIRAKDYEIVCGLIHKTIKPADIQSILFQIKEQKYSLI